MTSSADGRKTSDADQVTENIADTDAGHTDSKDNGEEETDKPSSKGGLWTHPSTKEYTIVILAPAQKREIMRKAKKMKLRKIVMKIMK